MTSSSCGPFKIQIVLFTMGKTASASLACGLNDGRPVRTVTDVAVSPSSSSSDGDVLYPDVMHVHNPKVLASAIDTLRSSKDLAATPCTVLL